MKNLFMTITWLELNRLKNRTFLLAAIVVVCCLALNSCGNFAAVLDIASSQNSEFSSTAKFAADLSTSSGTSGEHNDFQSAPASIILLSFSMVGLVVVLTMPFRSKDEWENGLHQLSFLGDHSSRKIELIRFLSYCSIATVFYGLMHLCFALYIWKFDLFNTASFLSFELMVWHNLIQILPLLLAFGALVSSITTAYFQNGMGKLLNLMKYISCACFISLYTRLIDWSHDSEALAIPHTIYHYDIQGFKSLTVTLNWEFLIVSIAATIALLFWSAAIIENTES